MTAQSKKILSFNCQSMFHTKHIFTLRSWTAFRVTTKEGGSIALAKKSAIGELGGAKSLVCKHNSWKRNLSHIKTHTIQSNNYHQYSE